MGVGIKVKVEVGEAGVVGEEVGVLVGLGVGLLVGVAVGVEVQGVWLAFTQGIEVNVKVGAGADKLGALGLSLLPQAQGRQAPASKINSVMNRFIWHLPLPLVGFMPVLFHRKFDYFWTKISFTWIQEPARTSILYFPGGATRPFLKSPSQVKPQEPAGKLPL